MGGRRAAVKLSPADRFETICEESDITDLANGAQTGLTTSGANPGLVIGDVLRQVCVELPSQGAPVLVVLHLNHFGFVLELKRKWVRGPSSHSGAGALIWDGELTVGENPSLFVFVRNDTGGTITIRTHHTVDRVID